MLRLTIDGNEIELYENEPVNLSYQFSNLQDINASSSSFSQTFRVPLTKKNQDYFGPVNEFGLIPNWDPKTKADAELTFNTIPVMRGFVQVKAIYVQKGKYADVELVFFGETANLSHDIGDAMLSDLDLSSYNHTLNSTQIVLSWTGALSGGAIRYGLPDKGQNFTSSNIWTTDNPLEHGDFTPYFRVPKLLETILTTAGYTMESDFFDGATGFEEITDLYLLMNNGNRTPIGICTATECLRPGNNVMLCGYTSDVTVSGSGFTNLTGFSEASPFYDQNNNFNGTTYVTPVRAFYRFRVNIDAVLSSPGTTTLSVRLAKGGSTNIATIMDAVPGPVVDDTFVSVVTDPIFLNSGESITLQRDISASGFNLTLNGAGTIGPGTTGWEVVEITDPSSGQTVDTAANMPVMKQIDFVSGLQKMFNLVFIPDRNNAKKLYVEPFNTYLSAGVEKDFTNLIDLSKDITIEPTTDLQCRQYDWTHSNGKDLVNDLVFKNASRVYSRYRVDDPENDFASGTKEIKSPFAPHVVSYIPGTQFAVHRMLVDTDQDDKRIKDPLPRLAFWNGGEPGNVYLFNDANSATQTATTYPAFSQYSVLEASVEDEDLGYGPERPFHLVEANPLNTLYYKYWSPFVNQLYSSDARKLTAFFRLTRADIATFEFSDKIYLKDTYWRILSISYDATSEGLVKMELLKILSDIRDCQFLPTGIDKADGKIQFSNPSGATVTQVTRVCCEKYGYRYDNATSHCYQPFEQ